MKYIIVIGLSFSLWVVGSCTDSNMENKKVSGNFDSIPNPFERSKDSIPKEKTEVGINNNLFDSSLFYLGRWKPYMYIPLPIAALSELQVKAMMKSEVGIVSDSIWFFGFKCFQPSYNTELVSTNDYLNSNYPKINKDYLKIGSDSLTVLTFTCNSIIDQQDEDDVERNELLFDRKRNELILGRDGVFFYCKKSK